MGCQITVFAHLGLTPGGTVLLEEVVSVTGASLQSSAVPTTGVVGPLAGVRVHSDADCYVTWGDNPTALDDGTEGRAVGAENPEYFGVPPGQKLAVISRT